MAFWLPLVLVLLGVAIFCTITILHGRALEDLRRRVEALEGEDDDA